MSDGQHARRRGQQSVTVRTEAAMAAIMQLRQQLATETQIGKTDSAYMAIRGVIYDLMDGAYWDGFATGEDQSP